jgi:hypothetical protein
MAQPGLPGCWSSRRRRMLMNIGSLATIAVEKPARPSRCATMGSSARPACESPYRLPRRHDLSRRNRARFRGFRDLLHCQINGREAGLILRPLGARGCVRTKSRSVPKACASLPPADGVILASRFQAIPCSRWIAVRLSI